ncbi:MAG: type III pantothenate kinase [Dehalococcoidia bacterium]|nr:type III pantothenate kinase [Dehalococcoidia bacterium]
MLLAIDVGNTKVAIGVFEGDRLRATWRVATDTDNLADEYAVLLLGLLAQERINLADIKAAILCSVVPSLVPIFEELCQKYFKIAPLVVGAGIKTGVRICMDNPREVGADRVVNAMAAHRMYGGPLIVIDLGTATTFDVVSKDGDYLGGAIAPGVGIAAEALYKNTAKLPQVELVRPRHAIGKNTVSAMQSGIVFGYVGLVEGIVARIKQELGGSAKVIATGGLAELIARETKVIEKIAPDLTLVGLKLVYEINQANPAQPAADSEKKHAQGQEDCAGGNR